MEHENIHLSAFARAVIIAAASWHGLQRCRSNLVCLVRNHRYIWLNLILLAPSPSVLWVGDQSNLPGVIEVGTLGWLIANSRMWRKRKWVYFILLICPSIMLGTRWHDQPVRILEAGWSQTEAGKSKKLCLRGLIAQRQERLMDGWFQGSECFMRGSFAIMWSPNGTQIEPWLLSRRKLETQEL